MNELTTTEPNALIQIIDKVASNKDVDVAKLEKLLDMQERIMAKNAEMAFNSAMAMMQAELPAIGERGEIIVNGQVRSKYARFEDINDAVKPILQRHGFAVSFKTDTTNGTVKVTGILTHREGHRESTDIVLPVDVSGSKNAVQAVGSSVQYGKRYVMAALLNITTKGEDDDGKSAIPDGQLADFETAIESAADSEALADLWKKIAKTCQDTGDRDAYDSLKEKVSAKGKALKRREKAVA